MKVIESINNAPLYPSLRAIISGTRTDTTELIVLHEDDKIRQTIRVNEDNVATRYTAITKNEEWKGNKQMILADRAITLGEPMHDAFARQGFELRKNILDVYTITLTPRLRKSFGVAETFAKAKNSELIVRAHNRIYHYGMMLEIYSPEIISPMVTEKETQLVNFSFHTLKAAGFSTEEVWKLLGNESTDWISSARFEHL